MHVIMLIMCARAHTHTYVQTHYLLCCLMQGDDAVHDAVRLRELESGVPTRVVAALRRHGCSDDDVLWAALFLLAVLVRDNSTVFSRAKLALVRAGVLPVRPVLWMLVALHSVACTLHAVAVAH